MKSGIQVKQYFGGTYESAKTDGRKEFQRMISYVKKDKQVAFIIVANLDRFSRTGSAAAQLSEELSDLGVNLKSATQNIDNSNASGRMQENFFHMINHFDSKTKSAYSY